MFGQIDFQGLAQSRRFGYAHALPFFQGRSTLAFQPGLNVLVGPNGSGKSTVLHLLADTLCARQGGVSTITEEAVHDTVELTHAHLDRGTADKIGVRVTHDGQPVVFCDPRQTVGLMRGGFDDDFFRQGLAESLARDSHGEAAARRADAVMGLLMGHRPFPTAIDRRLKASQVNDLWGQALAHLDARLAGTLPLGQPTLLLDEPEANFGLGWQVRLWALLAPPKVTAKFQVIVASHSPFALGIPGAHYVEVEQGYTAAAEALLRERFGSPSTAMAS
jgi:predicted ATPase